MPKLSNKKRAELRKLSAKPDGEIDFSDIQEIQQIPGDAVIGRFYRPKKTSVGALSWRIDRSPMYLASVALLLAILPVVSVILEAVLAAPHGPGIMGLVGKWYVFWACGIRLLVAGIRQVIRPRFTAAEIFDLDSAKAFPMVREIGFGNLAMGTLAICTIFRSEWLVPAAIVGGLYYGLAGLGHLSREDRNINETVAMISDGVAFLVLLVIVVVGFR